MPGASVTATRISFPDRAKKLVLVALATAINAALLVLGGQVRWMPSSLPSKEMQMAIGLGMLLTVYGVYAAMLSFAPPGTHGGRTRLSAIVRESSIAFIIFIGVLMVPTCRIS